MPIRPFLRIEKLSNVIGVVPENNLDALGPPGLNSACVAIWIMSYFSWIAFSKKLPGVNSLLKTISLLFVPPIFDNSCSTSGKGASSLNSEAPIASNFLSSLSETLISVKPKEGVSEKA